MSRLFALYRSALAKHPWKTQLISCGVLCGAGDVISQLVVERRRLGDYEWGRTARFVGLGAVLVGPSVQSWYLLLERLKGGARLLPLKRVALDQLVFSPIFIGVFLFVLRELEGRPLRQSAALCQRDLLPVYKTGLKIWPAVQLLNFYLVPLNFRIIVVQFVALFWNTYLAYVTQNEPHEPIDSIPVTL